MGACDDGGDSPKATKVGTTLTHDIKNSLKQLTITKVRWLLKTQTSRVKSKGKEVLHRKLYNEGDRCIS